MRVTMYGHDYQPLAILNVDDADLRDLRRYPGDRVSVPVPTARFWDLRAYDPAVPTMTMYTCMVLVEGVGWADGVTRPILVVRGSEVTEQLLLVDRPQELQHLCRRVFASAVDAARRSLGERRSSAADARSSDSSTASGLQTLNAAARQRQLDAAQAIQRSTVDAAMRQMEGYFSDAWPRPGDRLSLPTIRRPTTWRHLEPEQAPEEPTHPPAQP